MLRNAQILESTCDTDFTGSFDRVIANDVTPAHTRLRQSAHTAEVIALQAAVSAFPPVPADRRYTALDGISAEILDTPGRGRTDFRFQGSVHSADRARAGRSPRR